MFARRPSRALRVPALAVALAALAPAILPACGDSSSSSDRTSRSMFDAPADDAGVVVDGPAIAAGSPTVVFLGDSIGAGLHLAEHQAFPAVLQRSLADDAPFELVNASESGRTTSGGVTALEWVLRREPDVVVIELGGNDGLRGIDLRDVEDNLREMVRMSRDAGAEVLLLGVRLPPNYGGYASDFDAMYPRLADELDVAFVPFFMEGVGGVASMNLADGLHPTAAGQERLAANVEDALRDLLEDLER